jgi:hypothetical protein
MKRTAIAFILLCIFTSLGIAQTIPHDSLYFGQTPPGKTPRIFAPGRISLPGRNEAVITFSPDGLELFYYVEKYPQPGQPYIMYSSWMENHWTVPDTIPFSVGRSTAEPIFSPDGLRLYMYANNAVNQQGLADLCYSARTSTTWSDPVSLGDPPNSESYQYHPCVVSDNSIYFSSGAGDVCRCQYSGGVYEPRVVLPRPVNHIGSSTWGDPYVSPDESYMLIKANREEGFGENDIYISYPKSNGTWTNPKNVGSRINTPNAESSGDVTPDGLYMTYGSNGDLYWVSTSFIDSLRYTNYLPYLMNPIPNQVAFTNEQFTFIIPDSTFVDDDGNNTLTFSARQTNGNPLPSWLTFDSVTMTFSGKPTATQILSLVVIVTDTAGASAKSNFRLTVSLPTTINEQKRLSERITLSPISAGKFMIRDAENSDEAILMDVVGMNGKKIETRTFRNTTELDLGDNACGVYIVRLTSGNETIVRKICVF